MKPVSEIDDRAVELGRLLEEALRCLASTDLDGANAALKRAHAEAARSVGVIDGEAPAGPRNGIRARG